MLKLFLHANHVNAEGFEKYFTPLKGYTNGLEWFSAPMTGWDRNLKAALKTFLQAQGEEVGRITSIAAGGEWDAQGTSALQSFLNKNGATLEVNGKMGLSSKVGSNWIPDPTICALQHFLNTRAFTTAGAPESGLATDVGACESN